MSSTPFEMDASLQLLDQLVAPEFFDALEKQLGLKLRERHFPMANVVWLMVFQRLDPTGTLGAAVEEARRRRGRGDGKAPCSRTGGYSQARTRLPGQVARAVFDHVESQLDSRLEAAAPEDPYRPFLLDGSTLRMPCTARLAKQYPPQGNQHGEFHWPLCRLLVAHSLRSGIARCPNWGSVKESEQSLAKPVMAGLPPGATVVADRNFGVFCIAWEAARKNHPVLLRMSEPRARRLLGQPLPASADTEVSWRASARDRATNPELPAGASLAGRLVCCTAPPRGKDGPTRLFLFTTLPLPPAQLAAMYGLRWNIETDLRSLKQSVRLEQLSSKSPEMVEKEILLAIVAYNLVRAVIQAAAQQAKRPPRGYSFAHVRTILSIWLPYLALIEDRQRRDAECRRMMESVSQSLLPRRKKTRPTYPREVWGPQKSFPTRKNPPTMPPLS